MNPSEMTPTQIDKELGNLLRQRLANGAMSDEELSRHENLRAERRRRLVNRPRWN